MPVPCSVEMVASQKERPVQGGSGRELNISQTTVFKTSETSREKAVSETRVQNLWLCRRVLIQPTHADRLRACVHCGPGPATAS